MLRKEFESRPLIVCSAAISLGVCVAINPVFGVLLLVLCLAWMRSNPLRTLALLAATSGFLLHPNRSVQPMMEDARLAGTVDVLTVPSASTTGERAIVQAGERRFIMSYRGQHDVRMGDRLFVTGEIRPLKEGTERSWLDRGVVASLVLTEPPLTVHHGAELWRIGNDLRRSFTRFVGSALTRERSAVTDALCFNQEAELSAQQSESLRRSGTVHIVSTSGLHVMVAAAACLWLLSRLPLPRWTQIALVAMVLLVYAAAAGFRAPIVRALIMAAVFFCAFIPRREPDALSAMGAAFVATFLWSPDAIMDIGFQLSFLTIGALVLFSAFRPTVVRDRPWNRLLKRLLEVGHSSLVALAASAPIVCYYFGYLPIVSVVANVLILPLVSLILVASLALFAFSYVSAAAATFILQWTVGPMADALTWIVNALGGPRWSSIPTAPFSGYWLLAVYVFALLLWRPHARSA